MPTSKSTARGGIYAIRHVPSGKLYIGSATNIFRRWREHRRHLEGGKHHSARLQNAWNKYGADAFVFEILQIVEDPDILIAVEQAAIDTLESHRRARGYNICPIAGSWQGCRHSTASRAKMAEASRQLSAEARSKIAEAARRRMADPDARASLSEALKGRQFSDETRAKLSEARKRRVISDETRAKLSEANRNRSAETRAKTSNSVKKKMADPELRAKALAGIRKQWDDPDRRAEICAARKQRWADPEYREKMAAGQRRRWAEWRSAREAAQDDTESPISPPTSAKDT